MEVKKIPLRTRLWTAQDDVVALVSGYTAGIAEPGDVIAIAETPLAVAQGRAIPSRTVRPRPLARFLYRFPRKEGSLATPQAMELAIREAGALRILLGVAAAAVGRLLGRKGDFYRVAGRQLAQIDDIGGTLPPYDTCIVLGPRRPRQVVEAIKRATGVDALVADVNDLRRADILAHTGRYRVKDLEDWLRDNPFGNDDQQTPLVVLKVGRA